MGSEAKVIVIIIASFVVMGATTVVIEGCNKRACIEKTGNKDCSK